MNSDAFSEKLVKVRQRFISALESKIGELQASLPSLSSDHPGAAAEAARAYQCLHSLVGVGATVGFPSTGCAARDAEDVLRPPYRECRGLTKDESALLLMRVDALRDAAERELRTCQAVR